MRVCTKVGKKKEKLVYAERGPFFTLLHDDEDHPTAKEVVLVWFLHGVDVSSYAEKGYPIVKMSFDNQGNCMKKVAQGYGYACVVSSARVA